MIKSLITKAIESVTQNEDRRFDDGDDFCHDDYNETVEILARHIVFDHYSNSEVSRVIGETSDAFGVDIEDVAAAVRAAVSRLQLPN